MDVLTQLLACKRWVVDQLLYRALEKLPALQRQRPCTIGFGSLLRTLHHRYAMDRVWRAHLSGELHGYQTASPTTAPPLRPSRRVRQRRTTGMSPTQLSAAAASESVAFEFIGGASGSMTREQILTHVGNHGSYHRGHIGQMMYDSGARPPTTDLPVFLRVTATREL